MFKGYSSKSKAKRGLETFNKDMLPFTDEQVAKLLTQGEDGKWGFDTDVVETAARNALQPESFNDAGIGTELQPVDAHLTQSDGEFQKPAGPEHEAALQAALQGDDVQSEEDGDDVQTPAPAPNMFSNLATTLSNVAAAAPVAPVTTRPAARKDYKIEKNRPEQNGIKRPGEGGMCRAVWDFLDEQRKATGEIPVAKQVRAHAEAMAWNMNNAMIEFYQWRKFNGIIGRAKKAA